jgi:hypothetical protein
MTTRAQESQEITIDEAHQRLRAGELLVLPVEQLPRFLVLSATMSSLEGFALRIAEGDGVAVVRADAGPAAPEPAPPGAALH